MVNDFHIGYYQKPFGSVYTKVDLSRVLNNIRGQNFKKLIDHARQLYVQERYEEYSLYKQSLPALTFSGTFSPGRSAANLTSYSKLIILDIDHIGPELATVKEKLASNKYVVAVWISPSGDGLKFLIRSPVTAEDHKEVYKQATQYFTDVLEINIDTSGSDVSRLCFISYDPEIFINLQALDFDRYEGVIAEEPQPKMPAVKPVQVKLLDRPKRNQDEVAKAICKKIYHYLRKRNLSITGTYDNWIRTAFAISNTFTPDYGIRMFLNLCRLDGAMHNEFESEKLIINCYNKGSATSSFKTVIFLAQEQGYQLDFNKKTKKS